MSGSNPTLPRLFIFQPTQPTLFCFQVQLKPFGWVLTPKAMELESCQTCWYHDSSILQNRLMCNHKEIKEILRLSMNQLFVWLVSRFHKHASRTAKRYAKLSI